MQKNTKRNNREYGTSLLYSSMIKKQAKIEANSNLTGAN